ncbi:hypothetical protein K466DRAFT_584378 [Polyporus arcularius HHB13444]|uniref:proton-translocating NAD(P)(+) transhydrogenase n=1 Tax=Polyporus arcularius HHB13444 TaxID=1314778 RepID=A0A5C3PJH8_9APHY|nr:hypothetical protein K466DRAFT_584378 [Polyporus arcularius HHB13444]
MNVDDAVESFLNSENVTLVAGYGIAVAKPQYAISDVVRVLRSKGTSGCPSSVTCS